MKDPKNLERNRRWRAANGDRKRAQALAHYYRATATPEGAERVRERSRKYYALNREKIIQRASDTRHKRRSMKRSGGASPGVRQAEWAEILETFGRACAYCLRTDRPLTRDHVVAISRGGLDEYENVVPACAPCNHRKQAGTLLRFISVYGSLPR